MDDIKGKTVGFIGGGQMAYAVAMGIVKGGLINPENMLVSNRSKEKLNNFSKEGIRITQNNMEVLSTCDIVFLAIKPQVFPVVVKEMQEKYGENVDFTDKLFVSVMGAITVDKMQKAFGENSKIIRTMPNTPCLVQAGTIVMCKSSTVTDKEYEIVKLLLKPCGECFDCQENMIDACASVMGCSCAYFFVAIEALADGGVMYGLPRPLAIKLAARAVMGAGKLASESDQHPEQLKDAVASPGGTTIRGLYALEKAGYRAALIDAVDASYKYNMELSKK